MSGPEKAEKHRDILSAQYTNACRLLEQAIAERERIALRGIEVQAENDELRAENQALRQVVEDACRAFGAPGDWGYDTREGDAVLALQRARAGLRAL